MKKIRPEQAENFVINALKRANRVYCKLSGGEWVTGRGVESFLGYFVAQPFLKFYRSKDVFVTLEATQSEFKKEFAPKLRWGKKKSRGRFDIVLWSKRGTKKYALAVIELKREHHSYGGYKKDIKRVASVVADCQKAGAGLQFGCFAACVSEYKGDEWISRDLKRDWKPLMKREAKRKKIKVRVFQPVLGLFQDWEDARVRFSVLGCVFFRKRRWQSESRFPRPLR
ncbi:MAG TPA: hypothetical protein VFA57_10880 [Pseudolabrys sp.]|nr:hypothetical protein [Pseudolabrys sp.]